MNSEVKYINTYRCLFQNDRQWFRTQPNSIKTCFTPGFHHNVTIPWRNAPQFRRHLRWMRKNTLSRALALQTFLVSLRMENACSAESVRYKVNVDLYSASSWSTTSNALPFPISRRWSPQANPTARHQRTLRDHVIRVGVPRDMPVYFPAFAGTKLYCLVTEAVGCEQLA